MYFVDVDKGVEYEGDRSVDAKVPYSRVNLTDGTAFEAKINHMVGIWSVSCLAMRAVVVVSYAWSGLHHCEPL